MSLTRMASSGSALSISCAARCGWIGVESSAKPGAMKLVPLALVALDRLEPAHARLGHVARLAAVELGQHLAQEGAHVRHQAERHRVVAGDLLGIDVDVDQPGRRDRERVAGQPRARGAVVEAHAERQQHVGLTGGMVRLIGAVAGDQAERQRMLAVDRAHAARGAGHRDAQPLGERQKIGGGAAILHPLADQDHRPLGGQQHVDRLGQPVRVGAAATGDVGVPLLGPGRLLGRRLLEDVERHVEHHRPGTSGHHGLPGLAHRDRHHLAAGRLEHPLAVGAHRRGEIRLVVAVQLLEGAAIELGGRHVAGHREERHRIEIRVAEADRQVGRARPAGGEGRDRLAGDPVEDVGHEARDRLVMGRDGLDVLGALVQGVDEADVAVPAQAEGVGHLLLDEIVDDHLTAVQQVACHDRPSHSWLADSGWRVSGVSRRQRAASPRAPASR